MKNEIDRERKYHIGYFVLSFFMVFTISFLVLFFLEKEVRETRIEELQRQEQRVVKLENDFLGREFSMVFSDLHYLHRAFKNELTNTINYETIAANWTEFSSQRRIYDQIRYLDASGNEKIRINIGENGGYAVPDKDLQNKKDRYYFTETMKLKDQYVYVSPLDLNIEQGEIEFPYKPMIRVSTPIYDEQGTLKGIIVLNFLADYMLKGFRELAGNSQGDIVLLNANGYRLSSSNPSNDWNFMFDNKKEDTFAKEYPNEWRSILKNEEQFTTDRGLITASSVDLSHKYIFNESSSVDLKLILGDGSWYIVSVFERNQNNSGYFNDNLGALLLDVLKKNAFYFLLLFIVSGVVGFLAYVNSRNYSRIKYYSEYDPLTKVLNRRAGIARLNELFSTDERRHFLASLCFIDINGLKEVNDLLGHKLGDELIVSASSVIKQTIREQDFLVRLGGDEFLIVFHNIDKEMAENIWQRVVQRYNQINQSENRPYIISVSHGIVDFDNTHKTLVDDLIHEADEKMYHEKQIIKAGLSVIKKNAIT